MYVGEIERSLLNIGIANQAATVGAPVSGIRSFALMHGHKNEMRNISTCCEGQGTRLHGSLPEYIFSLIRPPPPVAADGAYAGVTVDLYAAASITFQVAAAGGGGSGAHATVTTGGFPFPYSNDKHSLATVSIALGGGGALEFSVDLRIPAWTAAAQVRIGLNGNATFAIGQAGSYVPIRRAWRDGDVLALDLPMALRATEYVGLNQVRGFRRVAYEFGPTLLAARPTAPGAWSNATDCLELDGALADPLDPSSWLTQAPSPTGAPTLHFVPTERAQSLSVELVPYFEVQDEQMTVYPCFSGARGGHDHV